MRHAFTLVVLIALEALLPSSAQAPQSGSDVWQTIRNHLQTLDGKQWFDLVMKDAVAPNPAELWEGDGPLWRSGRRAHSVSGRLRRFLAPEITLTLLGKGDKPAALKQSVPLRNEGQIPRSRGILQGRSLYGDSNCLAGGSGTNRTDYRNGRTSLKVSRGILQGSLLL